MTDKFLYSLEAEQHVLGAIFIEPDSLLSALDIISPEDFYKDSHKHILNAFLDVYELNNGNIDMVSIYERLQAKGKLEDCGGATYLSQLTYIQTAASIKYHANLVKQKSLLRKLHRWAVKIQGEVCQADNIPAFLATLENGLIEMTEAVKEKKSPLIKKILSEIREEWRQEAEGEKRYIPTDHKLSAALPGFFPGHLIVIGGYTSVGKSTVLAQIIIDTCFKGAKCLIFSTEDSRREKTIKLLSNLSEISQRRLMLADFRGHEAELKQAEETLKTLDIKIYDDVYSVDEMRLKIKKHQLQGGLDIVALDFIQNVQGAGNSIYERMSDSIIKLQATAKELGVTIIVLSQVNNAAMRDESGVIGLKGAGELAAAADLVLWLKRDKNHERHLDCEIKKNRPFGNTGIIPLQFSESWTRIERRFNDYQ